MKKILLSLSCFALVLACVALAATKESPNYYRLVQVQMLDGGSDGKTLPIVYVLLYPDKTRPTVFQRFGSQNMEAWLSSLPRASEVIYDANGCLPPVDLAQFKALKTACEKKGVRFVPSAVN